MSTEKMREFEKYWDSEVNEGLRRSCAKGWALRVWQDSRAAIEVELPSNARMYFNGAPAEAYTNGIQCWHGGVSAAKQAIEAAGLKVKGG